MKWKSRVCGFHITCWVTKFYAGFVLTFKLRFDHGFLFLVSFLALLVEVLPEAFFVEEYPSVYHPPPTNLNEQADMIFLARLLHLGHLMCAVPMGTRLSVIVPSGH